MNTKLDYSNQEEHQMTPKEREEAYARLRTLKVNAPERLRQIRPTFEALNKREGTQEEKQKIEDLNAENSAGFIDWVRAKGPISEQVRVMRLLRPANKLQPLVREWQKQAFQTWVREVEDVVFHSTSAEIAAMADEVIAEP